MKKPRGLNREQQFLKRMFDIFFSFTGIIFLIIPILVLVVLATISTRKIGLFAQQRVGIHAQLFTMYKIRTMKGEELGESIAILNTDRITIFGGFLRHYNLDELPQLLNVLIGNMSFVGPRPDVKGYADRLVGDDKIILSVKPGITGPATLKFRKEEELLINQPNQKKYNDEIIWKEKVKINKQYIENWTLLYDIQCIIKTILN